MNFKNVELATRRQAARPACYNPPRLEVTFSVDAKYDSTEVEIFGQAYNVRGDGDHKYLIADEFSRFRKQRQESAAWLEKTEEISERLGKIIT